MPEISWEKLHIEKNQEPFGIGAEKKVYQDKENPDRVVSVRHTRESLSREAKGRFYLTKILHLLFPKNIPNIHLSSAKPNITVRKKVELDSAHHTIRERYLEKRTIDESKEKHIFEAMSAIANNPKVRALKNDLNNAGVDPETFPGNFGIDNEGYAQYIEDFDAFAISGEPFFDAEKLTIAIDRLPEKEQKQAMHYLEKLKFLAEAVNKQKSSKPDYETN